jgi:transcriptional antiterminator RfaH
MSQHNTQAQDQTDTAAAPSARWYLVQSRPQQAERAEENLQRQGYTVYHPKFTVERIRRGRKVEREESLFPNYLFIRLQRWVDNWYPLRSTRGVARLVSFGKEPLPVQEQLIQAIQARIEQGATQPAFTPGQPVEITEGAFKGLDAIFKAQKDEQRVLLLIELLHRQHTVQLPLTAIRSA